MAIVISFFIASFEGLFISPCVWNSEIRSYIGFPGIHRYYVGIVLIFYPLSLVYHEPCDGTLEYEKCYILIGCQ